MADSDCCCPVCPPLDCSEPVEADDCDPWLELDSEPLDWLEDWLEEDDDEELLLEDDDEEEDCDDDVEGDGIDGVGIEEDWRVIVD